MLKPGNGSRAAQSALDKSRDWVALAETADLEDDIEISVARIMSEKSDLSKATGRDDWARKRLEDRISKPEGFEKMAAVLASDLPRQLKKAGLSKGVS